MQHNFKNKLIKNILPFHLSLACLTMKNLLGGKCL